MTKQDSSNITHVCIALCQYALIQYMLLTDEETIKKHTFFIFNEIIPASVRKHFPNSTCIPTGEPHGREKVLRKFRILKFLVLRHNIYPFIKSARIYSNGGSYLMMLIRGREYELLQEAPHYITFHMNKDSTVFQRNVKRYSSIRGKLKYLIMGPTTLFECLYMSKITTIHLTEENDSPSLEGKNVFIKSFSSMWDNASKSKRDFILKVFNLTIKTGDSSNQHYMFLTQPLVDDGILTESEYVETLKRIFNNYDQRQIIIKKHPRDTVDYRVYFSDIHVYPDNVNLELLFLTGLQIKKAIAICTTSVNTLPGNVEIDWYGSCVHPKIQDFLGNTIIPQRPYNKCYCL